MSHYQHICFIILDRCASSSISRNPDNRQSGHCLLLYAASKARTEVRNSLSFLWQKTSRILLLQTVKTYNQLRGVYTTHNVQYIHGYFQSVQLNPEFMLSAVKRSCVPRPFGRFYCDGSERYCGRLPGLKGCSN